MASLSSRRRQKRFAPRGFTIAEIAVVACVVGIVAGVSVVALSNAAARGKRTSQLKSVFSQLEQIRAKHLATAAGPDSCLRMTPGTGTTFELDERPDCASAAGVVVHDFRSEVLLTGTATDVCIDSLARPASCADLTALREVQFGVEIDGTAPCEGIIVWRANGRLTANFPVDDNPNADVQAHLNDASSMTTPRPTAVGIYPGATANPRGLLE